MYITMYKFVLILIVVEDGLVLLLLPLKLLSLVVLILIVVEDGLVLISQDVVLWDMKGCLNPYCSGRWSRTRPYKTLLIINKLKSFTKEIFTSLN